jgi:hypothetical protein
VSIKEGERSSERERELDLEKEKEMLSRLRYNAYL